MFGLSIQFVWSHDKCDVYVPSLLGFKLEVALVLSNETLAYMMQREVRNILTHLSSLPGLLAL